MGLILLPIILVFCVIFVLIIIYFYSIHSSSVDFAEYSPHYLPTDVKVTGSTINVMTGSDAAGGISPLAYDKSLSISLNKGQIFEANNNNPNFTVLFSLCNYNRLAEGGNTTCSIATTSTGIRYDIEIDYAVDQNGQTISSNPTSQIVTWVQSGTSISASFEINSLNQVYSQATLSKFIDSFSRIHYNKLEIDTYGSGA